MPLNTTATLDRARDLLADAPSPVVVVAVYNAFAECVRCLEALTTHTPPEHAILVIDDGGSDRRIVELLEATSVHERRTIVVLQHDVNRGFVRSCNEAFEVTAGRDVVLVNSDVVVGPEWLDRLSAAACSNDNIATASTLTNYGTILSVPHRNTPTPVLPGGMTPDEAARRVATGSLQLRPSIPTAIGHCCYIRRAALDLVGGFDERFSPGYGEEVDFSQRCLATGFRHVCADDVFTYHRGGGTFGKERDLDALKHSHESIIRQRYPWYGPAVRRAESDVDSSLAHTLATAKRSLVGCVVGIDALCLGPDRMGTQQIVVETIRVLAKRPEIARLVVFVPLHLAGYVRELRDELRSVDFIAINPVLGAPERVVDLIYRPYQVSQLAELDFLYRVGDRFVVNQLDTIAFADPAYFESDAAWLAYRDLTRLTLRLAHGVAFLSEHGRASADAEGLLDHHKPTSVVSCGISSSEPDSSEQCPVLLPPADKGFVLCLGASYLHKGRPFALSVWMELRRRGWMGRIVLAGPTPPHGNSLAHEAELLLGRRDLRPDVITLGSVSEEEKRWLYRRAALVIYPSVIEGFGIVPFEAALFGAPTLASGRGSMHETLPRGIPVLDGFDVARAADEAWRLLHDAEAVAQIVEDLRSHGASYDWTYTGDRLIDLFDDAFRQPRDRTLVLEGEGANPIGMASRAQRATSRTTAFALERLVSAVITRPALKNGLSPDGSRRQRLARTVISQARRRTG